MHHQSFLISSILFKVCWTIRWRQSANISSNHGFSDLHWIWMCWNIVTRQYRTFLPTTQWHLSRNFEVISSISRISHEWCPWSEKTEPPSMIGNNSCKYVYCWGWDHVLIGNLFCQFAYYSMRIQTSLASMDLTKELQVTQKVCHWLLVGCVCALFTISQKRWHVM